ncbi:hypothetical protein M8C13_05050 [Crossiella sp. SN42]|uniref:hypothetical protein n=1 Tax=Crossiella sp. SN42 TaxID=2944808 RepID=UPI00207CF9E0|nr:hypothetical protein [Crossiella sp. SN42]MCO1575125.1 hypothetical protein [Crossiella sp. SN42]
MPEFLEIARVVFDETRAVRRDLHRVRGALGCDAVYELAERYRISGNCPCVDEFTDAVVKVWRYLESRNPDEVRSYGAMARAHCQLRIVGDLVRARRGARGLQRTEYLADSVIGRALATDQQRALLRHLADEAASSAPLGSDAQLLGRLAELRAQEFGGSREQHRAGVVADLPVVREAALRHGRRRRDGNGDLVSWWEFYIETGLGRRERLNLLVDVDLAHPHTDHVEDEVVVSAVLNHARNGTDVPTLITHLGRLGLVNARLGAELLADPNRRDRASRAVAELVAATVTP